MIKWMKCPRKDKTFKMLTLNNYKVLFFLLLILILLILIMNLFTKPAVLDNEYIYIDDVLLDQRTAPTEIEIFERIALEIPSSPIEFWLRNHKKTLQLDESCALYPHILNLEYHNTYWQKYTNLNLTYYLYGAYYDIRPRIGNKRPIVRILALVNQLGRKFPPEYCQMWFNEFTEPVIVPVKEHSSMWVPKWTDNYEKLKLSFPVFINCLVPKALKNLIPQTISLVTSECATATNNLKVTYEPLKESQKKSGFAVCVKAMWFPYSDQSARLVEWLEMLRILGAEKVTIYNQQTHPNNTRVLEYYHRQGFVDYPSYTMGRGEPNTPGFSHMIIKKDLNNYRLNQMIQLNDCFYRNMYRFDYLAIIDVDELIMPMGNLTTWHDILPIAEKIPNKFCNKKMCCSSAYCFRHVYFPPFPEYDRYSLEVPKYLHMLQHVRRTHELSNIEAGTKCFHNTEVVIAVHNHCPRIAIRSCIRNPLNMTIGQMQHYREPDLKSYLDDPVIDNNIWRYKETLVARSLKVLQELGYFKKKKTKLKYHKHSTKL